MEIIDNINKTLKDDMLVALRSFQIPTPVGSYAPDWAIAMQKGNVEHIFYR